MPMRDEKKVRMPVVAGQFYDGDPLQLRRRLMETEAAFPVPVAAGEALPRAVILPHAGYMFSLKTAFKTLRLAARGKFRRVVLLAPSHRVGFRGLALSPYDTMRTPFGDLPVDRDAATVLAERAPGVFAVREDAHCAEHALEVQLPLLQYVFGAVEVLPLVCGGLSGALLAKAADCLTGEWRADTLWVISSDFTHYGPRFDYVPFREEVAENLRRLDGGAIDRICRRDAAGLTAYWQQTGATICGIFGILLLLAVLDRVDPGKVLRGEMADYSNSGELTGDWGDCVSYAGVVFR